MPEPWLDVYARPQRLVEIGGGRRLNVHDIGKGPLTVLLFHGFGGSTLTWRKVQPAVGEFSRAIAFDIAGAGFSDPGPFPRTASKHVSDVRAALKGLGVSPPYVLVGHSAGSLDVRYFAFRYPEEVAGIVITDGSSEGQAERYEAAVPNYAARTVAANELYARNAAIAEAGPSHPEFAALLPSPDPELPDAVNETLRAWYARPETWRLLGNEHDCRYGASSDEVLALQRDLGATPICALIAGRRTWDLLSAEDGAKLLAIWQGMQKEFAQRSVRGIWRIIPDCGHAIPSERPDVVIAAIREIADMLR